MSCVASGDNENQYLCEVVLKRENIIICKQISEIWNLQFSLEVI